MREMPVFQENSAKSTRRTEGVSLDELADHYRSSPPRGEIVIIVAGKGKESR